MNKLLYAVIAVVVIAAGAFVFIGSGGESQNSSNSEATETAQTEAVPNQIVIENFAYNPATITIKKGTTLTWVNKDEAKHDITPTSGASDFMRSELLSQGESHSATFDVVGEYEYKCSPHPYMKGKIIVTE